ncbi:MAG: hypothetical protein A2651_01650 [Candidatus Yanofskybacteria bacterium RIFCSPHIGHO2_01_FULL_42_12]|nr:MAG: hypothetical protein A2651_01650 [Candidatus Yanofskybacteria bacterium RIFCSPHIGHO2_01_FULL_42_12]
METKTPSLSEDSLGVGIGLDRALFFLNWRLRRADHAWRELLYNVLNQLAGNDLDHPHKLTIRI